MGKVEYFRVEFQDGKTTFFPSEIINGHVNLKATKELKLRGIRVEFHGEANVFLTWEDQRRKRPANSEVFINLVATLFGKAPGQAGDNPVLAPGEYAYPFQFHIPSENLPTSVEGNFGHVRYWLKAFIDRPWRFDITAEAFFTVIERVDINVLPGLLHPCQVEQKQECFSGPLSVTVQTNKGGYCPGESIAVSAFINNQSSSKICGVEINLFQISVYTIKSGKQGHWFQKVASVKRYGEIGGKGDHDMEMVPLPIPMLPPTMANCSCIKISYEIKFVVHISGWSSKDLTLTIPITIGSVPYQPPSLPSPVEPSAPPLDSPPPYSEDIQPPSLPSPVEPSPPPLDCPPPYNEDIQPHPGVVLPLYAECVYGEATIRDENNSDGMVGDSTFTPMYPFVNHYQIPFDAGQEPQASTSKVAPP